MNRYITSPATEMQEIINMIDIFYALVGKKKTDVPVITWDGVSSIPGCSWTPDSPASASQVLRFQSCATMSSFSLEFYNTHNIFQGQWWTFNKLDI